MTTIHKGPGGPGQPEWRDVRALRSDAEQHAAEAGGGDRWPAADILRMLDDAAEPAAGTILAGWQRIAGVVDQAGFLSPESVVDRVAVLVEQEQTIAAATAEGPDPARALVDWLIAMDEPDNESGRMARRTVTLTEIIRRAGLVRGWLDIRDRTAESPDHAAGGES